ncbi:hypothetical protein [Burkholderia diffusa]|uniref:hypothetical protein n=1 Tax=Burkholderia diffusa TaxID=488732 RepID=UPI0034513B52
MPGSILATRLHGDLDVVLVRKLRAPWQQELAIDTTMIAARHAARMRHARC